MKLSIALLPPIFKAYNDQKELGGGLATAGTSLVQSYSGYNMQTRTFNFKEAGTGYIPLAAAWLFGKVASRVLR